MSLEDDLIARYFAPLAGPAGLGLRDDAALLAPPDGCELVVTVDALSAGVHFLPDDSPEAIARKALRVNISDLAAKGAEPLGFVLSLALPKTGELIVNDVWLQRFAQALGQDAVLYRCPLAGGDTVSTLGPLTLSITAFGHTPAGRMVKRDGAKAGDVVYVSGTIGDAALGLAVRLDAKDAWISAIAPQHRTHLLARYLEPQPRLALAAVVREYASAAMDVSDGLAGDFAKLMRVSGVAGEIDLSKVPLSDAALAAVAFDAGLLERAVTGGDDYEILCTVPDRRANAFEQRAADAGVRVTSVGQVREGAGVTFLDAQGQAATFSRLSYSHV